MIIEPREHLSERVTIRTRPKELNQIDEAAQVASVTRSRVLREGALQLAEEILREAEAEGSTSNDTGPREEA